MLKKLPAMQETHVLCLGWKDLREKEMARQKEPGGLQSVGSQRVKHDGAINKFSFSAYDLLSFAGRQTYIHIWALTGSNCVNLSKKHNTLSEPQNHHLYSGDDINNSPEDE